jgi:osmotically-inducible protein OsmY
MRNDKQFRSDLLAELNCEPSLDAKYIGVSVASGIATLTGHVASFTEKLAARAAARRVEGVEMLVEKIDVMLPANTKRPDMEIASDIAAQLRGQSGLPCGRLTVQVEQGRVKLLGDVDWQHQSILAIGAAAAVSGVRDVVNLMAVRPDCEPAR